jgi:hypothetical protein
MQSKNEEIYDARESKAAETGTVINVASRATAST